MKNIPFDEKELQSVRKVPGCWGGEFTHFDYPLSIKENYIASVKGQALWIPTDNDIFIFGPNIIPDNVSRGLVCDAVELPMDQYGNKDMFGVVWEYIPEAGGATVRPGEPMLTDMNDWREIVKFPDIESWDWKGSAAQNRQMLEEKKDQAVQIVLLSAFFERMIALMDFENAAVALIDPDQQDAVREFLDAMADLWINIVDHMAEAFPGMIDEICVHDDWGSQRGPLFSEETVREMILPPMKRLVDHIRAKGYIATFHCCGKVEQLVPCMVDIGWQTWEAQEINDVQMIYEEYGDRLRVTLMPEPLEPETTHDEYKAAARAFAKEYCRAGKNAMLCTWEMPEEFWRELYRESRIAFSGA